ncbi:MAG: efflux RND transporter permease subunit [Gemmatimonadaceae bacterium]|nr:efflux RND transporter permease subunit [Gemmatimonadaceae bacterium]
MNQPHREDHAATPPTPAGHLPDGSPRATDAHTDAMARIKRMGGLVGIAISQPVFTTMIMLGLMVLGVFSYLRLSIDQYPDISIPIVSIQTTYAGASPEAVEREVTKRIEEAVNPTQGLKKVTSISLEGVSSITVEFELGTNVDAATADVRSKIEQIRRNLPSGIDQPVVQTFDPSAAPILSLALASERTPIGELTTLADNRIRRTLESVSGVGRVQVTGGLKREVHVLLNPGAMEALDVSVGQVMSALQQQNLDIPAGRIESQNREELVRVLGRIERPDQFGRIILADRNGSAVRLSQIATVRDTTEEARSVALVDGRRAIGIDLLKVSGANTVDVANKVAEALPALRASLPEGATLTVVRDNSVQIQQSVTGVQHELIIGAVLTVLIVFLFLGDWRATVITALTLPVSVISTFILLNALGFTLNILTLMALSLSIGILIDDAIVVIENIVRRREMGEDPFTAAAVGTQEIFLAVMATTFTLVAVFVPVAFMGGIIGKFFFQFGMTIAWAVLVSLFVSFTLTPMLAAWWSGHEGGAAHGGHASGGLLGGFGVWFNAQFDRLARAYHSIVVWALNHRRTTLVAAVVAFVGAIALFPLVGGSFMPDQDNGEFTVTFKTPTGSSLPYSEAKTREIGTILGNLPGVDFTYGSVGAGITGSVTSGEVFVKLLPRSARELSQQEIMPLARAALAPMFGAEASVLVGGGMGGAVKPLQIALRGPDFAELERVAERVMVLTRNVAGAIEVESSVGSPKPEVQLRVNIDRANDLGLDVSGIANTVRPLLAGQTATTWEDPEGEERDVIVRLPAEDRTTAERIASLPIATSRARGDGLGMAAVPLGQVAQMSRGTGPAQIDHEALQRVITISSNVDVGYSLSKVSDEVQSGLDGLELPAGYSASMGGDTQQLEETTGYVLESLLLAVVLIYLILASQFGSFTQPFAIMLALPLSLVGVMAALLLTGDTLNIMSMIGIILLMGLVTKNAILLVDNANQHRGAGMAREAALAEAGSIRLRPIIMTTLAMIFGMLPIALGTGEGGEFRAPMARAVIGGLITSTLLTLIVVPVVYTYFEDFAGWFVRVVMRRPPAAGVDATRDMVPVGGD